MTAQLESSAPVRVIFQRDAPAAHNLGDATHLYILMSRPVLVPSCTRPTHARAARQKVHTATSAPPMSEGLVLDI